MGHGLLMTVMPVDAPKEDRAGVTKNQDPHDPPIFMAR
jgi:hypothetical protein